MKCIKISWSELKIRNDFCTARIFSFIFEFLISILNFRIEIVALTLYSHEMFNNKLMNFFIKRTKITRELIKHRIFFQIFWISISNQIQYNNEIFLWFVVRIISFRNSIKFKLNNFKQSFRIIFIKMIFISFFWSVWIFFLFIKIFNESILIVHEIRNVFSVLTSKFIKCLIWLSKFTFTWRALWSELTFCCIEKFESEKNWFSYWYEKNKSWLNCWKIKMKIETDFLIFFCNSNAETFDFSTNDWKSSYSIHEIDIDFILFQHIFNENELIISIDKIIHEINNELHFYFFCDSFLFFSFKSFLKKNNLWKNVCLKNWFWLKKRIFLNWNLWIAQLWNNER